MSLISWLQRTNSAPAPLQASFRADGTMLGDGKDVRGDDQRRYCVTLTSDDDSPCGDTLSVAWKQLKKEMALVPSGEATTAVLSPVMIQGEVNFVSAPRESVFVHPLYIDRYAVSNADFAEFVAAGSYQEVDLWPAQVLPHVLQFVDMSGRPGPRYWQDGRPPAKKLDHPVVGVSWFEALAYAQWSGKRLPTAAEWQRAGTWPAGGDSAGNGQRYPWGNSFDANRANTWTAHHDDTVPVHDYLPGCTPNGVHQLIGNVWEWTATRFESPQADDGLRMVFDQPMAEIRGGAFNTYFETQATCCFSSAKPYLHRGVNVGFRCCVSAGDLQQPLDPFDLADQLLDD